MNLSHASENFEAGISYDAHKIQTDKRFYELTFSQYLAKVIYVNLFQQFAWCFRVKF